RDAALAYRSSHFGELGVFAEVDVTFEVVDGGAEAAVLVDAEGNSETGDVGLADGAQRDVGVGFVGADDAVALRVVAGLPVGAAALAVPGDRLPPEAADLADREGDGVLAIVGGGVMADDLLADGGGVARAACQDLLVLELGGVRVGDADAQRVVVVEDRLDG